MVPPIFTRCFWWGRPWGLYTFSRGANSSVHCPPHAALARPVQCYRWLKEILVVRIFGSKIPWFPVDVPLGHHPKAPTLHVSTWTPILRVGPHRFRMRDCPVQPESFCGCHRPLVVRILGMATTRGAPWALQRTSHQTWAADTWDIWHHPSHEWSQIYPSMLGVREV